MDRSTGLEATITWIAERIPPQFRPDVHMWEVMHGASEAFGLRFLGLGLGLGFNVLLARLLGAQGAGIYYLALTVTSIASVIGRVGLDNALLRFTAAHAAQQEWGNVAGVYRKGSWIAISASTITMVVIFGSAPWVANSLFSEPSLAQPLRLMALSILPLSLLTLYGELLRALKKILESILVQGLAVPLLNLPLLALLGGRLGNVGAAIAYVMSCVLVLGLGRVLWHRATPQLAGLEGNFDTRLLITTSLPLFWVALMNLVMGMTDTVFLGIWTDSKSVGIYNITLRLAALTTSALAAVNTIIAPKFAAIYAQGDYQTLGRLARNSSMLMALLAMPFLLLFVLAPTQILRLFGSEFSMGASALAILAIGQFINVATGSVGYLLIMTGHEKLVRNNATFSLALNITLQILLIPKYGLLGAAISTATSLAAMNLISVALAYRKLSIITLPIPRRLFHRGKSHKGVV